MTWCSDGATSLLARGLSLAWALSVPHEFRSMRVTGSTILAGSADGSNSSMRWISSIAAVLASSAIGWLMLVSGGSVRADHGISS